MSIESPVGTLDIKNATLRVGKLEVSNIQGIDTALNVTRANSVLVYDDQASTTTFNGTTSSAGVRDTVNGYLDVSTGYVYWGQKLPNSWVMEFEMDIRSGTNAGSLNLNVFSSINTGSDGYSIVFDDNGDNIILKYDGATIATVAVSGLFTASENWQKVVINYERGTMIIGISGERKLYYQDIERETPYTTGEYINFSSASADGRKIRDLKITNGSKWIYAGESNVVYTQGSVGVGVTDPTTALDVSGTVKATALEGDGSAITNISSANVGDFASNVTRIETLETDLSSNATRVSTLETDLGSNVTRIETLETGNMTISGQKTFSGDVIFESNVHMQGDVFVANTVNMTVSDPIIELGSNNLNTGDLGIIMTRHGATNSNIAIVFDESADVLRMGYTLGGASDADITLDSNALAVSVQGAFTAVSVSGDGSGLSSIQSSNVSDFASNVTRITNLESSDMTIGGEKTFSSNLQVGTANLFVDTTTSNVGVGTNTPAYTLDVAGDINFSGSFYQGGSPFVSSEWTTGASSLYYRSNVEVGTANLFVDTTTSNVGVGTNTPAYTLDVAGDINFSGSFYQGGSPFVSSEWTTGASSLYYRSNVEVGTANLFVDTTTSNVGVGTNTPAYTLDVVGDINFSGSFYQGGSPFVSSEWTTGASSLYYRSNVEVGTANLFVDTTTGNVGIGTATPEASLHIGPKNTDHIYLASINNDYGWKLDTADQGGGDVPFRIIKRTNDVDSTVVTIKNQDGYIGIGTDSPAFKLDVHGSANVGALTATTISGPLTGNAATATKLATARTIGGVSFDGSGNINLPGVNTAGNQNTSGNAATATTATNQSGGTVTCTSGTFSGTFSASTASSRDKFRVYPTSQYCIGMQSGVTFGDLNDWSMTFQMNSEDDRGFWWGDDGHSVAQGAMALSTRGWLNVAERIKVGGGQSDTSGPSYPLHVVGEVYATGAFYTDSSRSVIRGGSPTLYFRDTDHNSAMIHNNDNLLYILRGGNDTETWTQVNSQWPWIFNLTNNDSTCGGNLYVNGGTVAATTFSGNATTATTATNQSGGTVSATTGSFSSGVYYNEWLRNNGTSASGLYWHNPSNPGYAWHIYPENRADMTLRTGSGNGGIKGTVVDSTARGYIHWTTGNEIGFLNSSRQWSLRCDDSKNVQIYGNVTFSDKLVSTSVSTDTTCGIMWNGSSDFNYSITRTSGAWTSPNFQQLQIKWNTGMILDVGNGTYGRSYVGVNDRMAIGSSYYNSNTKPPDNGLLVEGYVGIGQTSPSYKLHITDGDNSVALFGPNSTWSSYLVVGSGTNKSPSFNTSYAQVLTTNGNLHLDAGYTRDIYLNYYNGSRVLFGPGVAVVHSSDDRLKTQEELIENATQTLMKLKPQKYLKIHRLPEDNDVREPVPEAGLIAQDVWYDAPELRFIVKPGNDANPSEEKPPEPVTGDIQQDPDYSDWGTTPAGLSYICLIPYLIKSNQELYTEIQTLKTRITALENA